MQIDNNLRRQIERATVRATLKLLKRGGWLAWRTWDGEEWGKPMSDDDVLAICWNLDEVSVGFAPAAMVDEVRALRQARDHATMDEQRTNLSMQLSLAAKKCERAEHGVMFVFGNTFDTVSDWSYSEGDKDGFNAVMEKQHAEWERWQEDVSYLLRNLTQADRIALLCHAHREATNERHPDGALLPVLFIGKGGAPRYLSHVHNINSADALLRAHRLTAERISLVEVDSAREGVNGWAQRCYVAHA